IVGTFQYMAPEQLEGKEADARSDLWSLGAVLYEMATGRKAFSGPSQASLIASILKDEPQPVSQVQPLAPTALDRVVGACLTKDPNQRVQTAHDVKLHLEWVRDGVSGSAAAAQVRATGGLRRRFRGRDRLAWGVAAVASALALTLLVSRMAQK